MYNLQYPTRYDSAEWTQAVATNYDVSAQTLFVNCKSPTHVVIRTDTTMTVKFGTSSKSGTIAATSGAAITVAANTAFEIDLVFYSMVITTTGNTAVKIFMSQADP